MGRYLQDPDALAAIDTSLGADTHLLAPDMDQGATYRALLKALCELPEKPKIDDQSLLVFLNQGNRLHTWAILDLSEDDDAALRRSIRDVAACLEQVDSAACLRKLVSARRQQELSDTPALRKILATLTIAQFGSSLLFAMTDERPIPFLLDEHSVDIYRQLKGQIAWWYDAGQGKAYEHEKHRRLDPGQDHRGLHLLVYLFEHAGEYCPYEEVGQALWRGDISANTVYRAARRFIDSIQNTCIYRWTTCEARAIKLTPTEPYVIITPARYLTRPYLSIDDPVK